MKILWNVYTVKNRFKDLENRKQSLAFLEKPHQQYVRDEHQAKWAQTACMSKTNRFGDCGSFLCDSLLCSESFASADLNSSVSPPSITIQEFTKEPNPD